MADQLVEAGAKEEGGIKLEGVPVKLVVGSGEDCIFVHPSLLTGSEFFTAALKQEWVEGRSNSVRLICDKVETVKTYVQWLYTGSIIVKPYKFSDGKPSRYVQLAELYIFGEKVMDIRFQNNVINAIVTACRTLVNDVRMTPGADTIKLIYDNTPKSSPARKLLVHLWHDYGRPTWIPDPNSNLVQLPYEFLTDLTAALLDRERTPTGNDLKGKQILVGIPSDYFKSGETPKKDGSGGSS